MRPELAMRWVAAARARTDRDGPLVRAALETNFAWKRRHMRVRDATFAFITSHLASIDAVLRDAKNLFRIPTPKAVREFFGDVTPPAYTWNGFVWFTDAFAKFGPKCQAAMI